MTDPHTETAKLQQAINQLACTKCTNPEIRAHAALAAAIVLMVRLQGFAKSIEHLRDVSDKIENDIFFKRQEAESDATR